MIRRLFLRIGDFVFVTRPLILIPVWCFLVIGARAGELLEVDRVDIFPALICLTSIMVCAYLVNQVFDRESDRHNDKGHYLTRDILAVRTVVLMAVLAFLVASWSLRLTAFGQRLPLVVSLVLALAYSLPPLRLCARPFVDTIANAVGYGGLAFVIGFVGDGAAGGEAWRHAVPWIALVGATFLHTTILDIDGDAATGKRTTSVAIGVMPSAVVAVVLSVAGLAAALAHGRASDWLAVTSLAVSVPVFGIAALRLRAGGATARVSSNAVQAATAITVIAAAVADVRILAVVIPIAVTARLYYKARFGVSYPGPADAGASAAE